MSTETDESHGVLGLSIETEDRIVRIALGISSFVIFVVGMFPIYWIAVNSLKTRKSINEGAGTLPYVTPEIFTLENFEVMMGTQIATYVVNTLVVTVGTIIMVVAISLVAGYGMARLEIPQKENFARFLLLGYMFSPIVLGLPLYLIWQNIGLLDTRIGLIVALSAISMPFSVWLMWKYIQTIPESMEERAWAAGASRWRGFRDVIVPQSRPAIIAASLFAFAIAWNDFTFAQILLPSDQSTTFAPGVFRLIQQGYNVSWGDIMAVSLLITLPPLLFAYFLQSYLLRGFQIRSL